MKLVIDIPEKTIAHIRSDYGHGYKGLYDEDRDIIVNAIYKAYPYVWIPVIERLPEEGKNVLFCDIDNDIMLGYHLHYAPATHFVERGAWEDVKNVRAWMPLPEPYKGGDV